MSQAIPPFLIYTDTDGQPLENGYLYFGTANQNPIANPINIYWDVANTIPAPNPVRTINGYASNNGTPGNIFTSSDFSIAVKRSDGTLVYSRASNLESSTVTAGLSYWLTGVAGTDAITATAGVGLTSYQDGLVVRFQSVGANTGAVNINVSSLGVVNVTKNGVDPLVAGDIPSDAAVELTYVGTGFQLTSITPNEYPTQAANSNNLKIANTAYVDRAATHKILPVSASVAGGALTITLDKCTIDFRSTTLSSGAVNTRTVSSPISVTVSSGSTLGTSNGIKSRLAVLAIDNNGTVELAVTNWNQYPGLTEFGLITTTAEGGVGGADSGSTIYSTTARANVAYRVVGVVESTQAAAGTWATAPSLVQGVTPAMTRSLPSTVSPGDSILGMVYFTADGAGNIALNNQTSNFAIALTEYANCVFHYSGTYRIKFTITAPLANTTGGRIYKNGVAFGTSRSVNNATTEFSEDLYFAAGDTMQLFLSNTSGAAGDASGIKIFVADTRNNIIPPTTLKVGVR